MISAAMPRVLRNTVQPMRIYLSNEADGFFSFRRARSHRCVGVDSGDFNARYEGPRAREEASDADEAVARISISVYARRSGLTVLRYRKKPTREAFRPLPSRPLPPAGHFIAIMATGVAIYGSRVHRD